MSDYSISSVSSVRVSETPVSPTNNPALSSGGLPAVQANPEQALAVQGRPAPKKQDEPKRAVEPQDKPDLPISNMDTVMIRFSVDKETNNLTVYVIDKASKRVLRAIPPEDLNKMQAGDLLELLV